MTYVLAGTLGGAAAGAGLAALGSLIAEDVRVALATTAALVGVPVGMFELVGRRIRPLQCDRETPRRWMSAGAIGWAARNGLALGTGASSRLGFVLWYVVPTAAFLSANVALGAGIFATYGFCRTAAAYVIIRAARTRGFEAIADALHRASGLAHMAAAGQLTVLALTTLIVVGM